jgi:hypothetical protein
VKRRQKGNKAKRGVEGSSPNKERAKERKGKRRLTRWKKGGADVERETETDETKQINININIQLE